jgi:hypothetical protein
LGRKQLCNRYKGNFKQGMRDGYGVFFYSTGARYAGQWVANVKQGEGTFTFEDGSVYEGLFQNDRCVRCVRGSLGLLPAACTPTEVTDPCTRPARAEDDDTATGVSRPGTGMGAVKPLLTAPATPVRLDIRDLLALECVPEESMRHINNLVLRFNTELKGVYRHYSQVRHCVHVCDRAMPRMNRLPSPPSTLLTTPVAEARTSHQQAHRLYKLVQ